MPCLILFHSSIDMDTLHVFHLEPVSHLLRIRAYGGCDYCTFPRLRSRVNVGYRALPHTQYLTYPELGLREAVIIARSLESSQGQRLVAVPEQVYSFQPYIRML